ncbi:MAG TPA: hypothetical protein VFM70_02010 [Salinimicrobium sp.]|nr:hypothetical protein [Salinimicrobium sp.]
MQAETSEGKSIAVIAYITFVGTIIAAFMNIEPKDKFAAFHIRQALGLDILIFLIGILVGGFNSVFISLPFYIFVMVLWGYGIISAIQGSTKEVPLVGTYIQKIFSSKK